MAPQQPTKDLHAYVLDKNSDVPVREWLDKLAAEVRSSEELQNFQFEVVPKDDPERSPADAAFEGVPFILAGTGETIQEYLKSCNESARRVIADCAYFWTLSEADRPVPAIANIAKNAEHSISLSWRARYFNHVLDPLRLLKRHSDLSGLSRTTHQTREDIGRIANADQGAFSPVLILGGPGTGKEKVARELWNAYRVWKRPELHDLQRRPDSNRKPSGINQALETEQRGIACGWLSEHLLQDQLFGHEKGAFTGADSLRAGLLEELIDGCIFLDDFDVAPTVAQGALLRVMSTDWGKMACFPRLGGAELVKTNAWLLFATNADIHEKIEVGEFRPDFVYRFEDRVIHLRPLGDRPADIPQIALRLWEAIWSGRPDPIRLGPAHIDRLLSPHINWEGSIRQLRALLSLSASRRRLTRRPLLTVIDEILARGDYKRWVGIILEPQTRAPALSTPALVMPSYLSPAGASVFSEICTKRRATPTGATQTERRTRLVKILDEAFLRGSITTTAAKELNGVPRTTADKDLSDLAGALGQPPLLWASAEDPSTYRPVDVMFKAKLPAQV